jgi:hypothetical protein
MIKNATFRFIALLCAMLVFASLGVGQVTIVAETFNRADNTNMDGQQPNPTNLVGNAFSGQNNRSGGYVSFGNELRIGPDASLSLFLDNYFTGTLTVSATINRGNLSGTGMNRGVGVGFNTNAAEDFNNPVTGAGSWVTFTGLRFTTDSKILFQSAGTSVASVSVSSAVDTDYSLSYDVDTTTGQIANIDFAGQMIDFSSIYTASALQNYFSGTDHLSVFAGGAAAGQYGYIDNLTLTGTAVPEPAMIALFMGLACVLGIVRFRRD